jgi:hypothetical protein
MLSTSPQPPPPPAAIGPVDDDNNTEDDVESFLSSNPVETDEMTRSPQNQSAVVDGVVETKEEDDPHFLRRGVQKVIAFYRANEFPLNVLIAIALAKAYPPLGAEYLQPKITGTYNGTHARYLLCWF